MGSERVTYFSTDAADQCFLNEFVLGVGAVLGGEINKAADLYNDIGVLWYNVEKMLAGLKGTDARTNRPRSRRWLRMSDSRWSTRWSSSGRISRRW